MTKRRALSHLCEVVARPSMLVGDYTCAGGLTDREREGIITERSLAI